MVGPGRDDHLVGGERTPGGAQHQPPVRSPLQAGDADPLDQRRIEGPDVGLQVVDDLLLDHETVRIGSGIRESG